MLNQLEHVALANMEEVSTAATLAQFLGYTGMGLAAVHAIR